MVVMKIKLYKDSAGALHAEFLDGLNSVSQNNSNVNGVLVVLDNFDLMPEEVLRIAYELESGAEVDDYTLMEDNGDGTYSADIPPVVTRSDVGTEWFLGLQIASDWVENNEYTGYLYKQNLVERLKFTVNNAVKDLNGKYPNRGDLSALYQEAETKIKIEKENAKSIAKLLLEYKKLVVIDKDPQDGITLAVSMDFDSFNKTPSYSSAGVGFFKVKASNNIYLVYYTIYGILPSGNSVSDIRVVSAELVNDYEKNRMVEVLTESPLVYAIPLDFQRKDPSSITTMPYNMFNRPPKLNDVFYTVGLNMYESGTSAYLRGEIIAIKDILVDVKFYYSNNLSLVGGSLLEKIYNTETTANINATIIEENKEAIARVEARTADNEADIFSIRQDIINEAHFRGYLLTDAEVQSVAGNANDYAYSAESGTKWIYQGSGWVDSGVPIPDQGVPASDMTPLMDGEANAGQEGAYARGDHRHPKDTSKVNKTGDTMTGPLSVAKDDYNKTTLENGGVAIEEGDAYMPDQFPTRYSHDGISHDGRTIHFPRARWKESTEDDPTIEKLDETIAMLSDLHVISSTNIQNGTGNGAVQQVADGSVVIAYSWDFTGRNANAEADDPSLSGTQPYGGVGKYSATFGGINSAQGGRSFAVNNKTIAKGDESFAQGYCSVAAGPSSFAGGTTTYAKGEASVTLGALTQALADYAVALGSQTKASGVASFAGGVLSYALGYASFSYGNGSEATGESSWATGDHTLAEGKYSYATGCGSKALGQSSFAEGWNTEARGAAAHAQGSSTKAIGPSSHAGGVETIAGYDSQTAIGRYNDNKEENIFEVGNGDWAKRSNAFEVRADGSAAYVGGKKLLMEGDSGSGGTKLYKHTFAELNGEDADYNDFLFLSARSTPYTNMAEVKADFRLPTTCITCYHEALGYMRCYEVHTYGGFYFEGKTFSMGAAFNVTDTVTEYKG